MAVSLFNYTAQGAGTTTKDFDLPDGFTGAVFFLDITAVGGSPTVDIKMQYLDTISGKAIDVPGASFAQKTGTGTSQLSVYAGLTASANVAVTQVLTKNLRVSCVIAGTGTPTATMTLSYQPVR